MSIRLHPVAPGTRVTGGYRTLSRPLHAAIDFGVPSGTVLKASIAGVIKTGSGHKKAGTWVEIVSHDGKTIVGYSHMSSRTVKAGQHVTAGQIIGRSGATGNVQGAHLHYYVKVGGKHVNPLSWLAAGESVTVEDVVVIASMARLDLRSAHTKVVVGDDVGRLQGLLLAGGYGPVGLVGKDGRPDKRGGAATQAILAAFQEKTNTGDGKGNADKIVGAATWSALLGG